MNREQAIKNMTTWELAQFLVREVCLDEYDICGMWFSYITPDGEIFSNVNKAVKHTFRYLKESEDE